MTITKIDVFTQIHLPVRYSHIVASTLILVSLLIFGCDDSEPLPRFQQSDSLAGKQILGVCFMGNESCQSTYVDLGPYEAKSSASVDSMIPLYIFPSASTLSGGIVHPFDSLGEYRPFRLQNNVFAGPGRVWSMYEIYSRNLLLKAEPLPGLTLWGSGVTPPDTLNVEGPPPRIRDLYKNPIKSEQEIFELERIGDIRITDLLLITDCPLVVARPIDTVVNLNPNYPVCQ